MRYGGGGSETVWEKKEEAVRLCEMDEDAMIVCVRWRMSCERWRRMQ